MNIIKPNAVYLDPDESASPYAFIERIGRTCYKSEDKITPESAVNFVNMLRDNKHTAMLEHAHILLIVDTQTANHIVSELDRAYDSRTVPEEHSDIRQYLNITLPGRQKSYISGSFRTFIRLFNHKYLMSDSYIYSFYKKLYEMFPEIFPEINGKANVIPDVKLVSRKEFIDFVHLNHNNEAADIIIKKHMTHTVLFTCDRGVSHEIVRHRIASYAMESTRYCNYGKGKFGSQITIIEPFFFDKDSPQYTAWKTACENAEHSYLELINLGATAQEARSILPHSVKTDIVVTATENEWQHILNLRYEGTTGKPHPQMKEVMAITRDDLIKHSDNRLK